MPRRLHSRTSAKPASVRPGPVSGLIGKAKGTPCAEDVVAAPDRAERAQPRRIKHLQRGEILADRLAAFHVQHGGEFLAAMAASMSALERQSFQQPARSSCRAIAAISMAMSSDGARSSGFGQRRRIVPVCSSGLFEHQIAGRDVDGAETADQAAGAGARQVDMAGRHAVRSYPLPDRRLPCGGSRGGAKRRCGRRKSLASKPRHSARDDANGSAKIK